MLNNPNWNKTVADPLTLDALIAWLEKKPADETYSFTSRECCLAAQYNASIGREYPYPQDRVNGLWTTFDDMLEGIGFGDGRTGDFDRTFGGALRRAQNPNRLTYMD